MLRIWAAQQNSSTVQRRESRQTLVWSPGDRRHGAYQTTGSSGVAKFCRSKLCLGPMMRIIQHCYPLAPLPAAARFMSYMRILAVQVKCG
jgi:hypothetical protein